MRCSDVCCGKDSFVLGVSVCALCIGGRCIDRLMCFAFGGDAGTKTIFLIGDGLSHVAFGAMAVAAVLGLHNDMPLILGITVVCAILLLRTGQHAKIKAKELLPFSYTFEG